MFDRVRFENFKSLRDLTIELERLTVLVGANGCGKSSVLEGMELLASVGASRPGWPSDWNRLYKIFDGPLAARRLASPGLPTTVTLAMRAGASDELALRIAVPAEPSPGRGVTFRLELHGDLPDACDGSGGDLGARFLRSDRVTAFGSAVLLSLEPRVMRKTSVSDVEEPTMGSDGANLASSLAWLAGARPELLQAICEDLAVVVPGVRRIRTYREAVSIDRVDSLNVDGQPVYRQVRETRIGDRFAIEFDDGNVVPADLLSEGTVLALGLVTKLHEPKRPRLILLDDLDRGLHLTAQAKLVGVLRTMLARHPDLQIVCTTHSAYALNVFQPEEVRVLALDARRETHAKRLTEHPQYEAWRYGVQTGEAWAALGEDWVVA